MNDRLRWGSVGFPGSGLSLGRFGRLPEAMRSRGATALGIAAAAGLAGSVYTGSLAIRYDRLATAERETARSAETANAELQNALARLRDELGSARQALGGTQRRLAELNDTAKQQLAASEEAASSKADRIAQLTRALEQTRRELHLAEAQRTTLMARLSKSEVDAAEDQARQQQQAQAGHEQLQRKVQLLAADRDKVATERDRLRARVGELEQRLSLLQTRQPPRPVAAAPPVSASPTATASARPASVPPSASPQPPRMAEQSAPVSGPAGSAVVPVAAHPAPAAATPVLAAVAPPTPAPAASDIRHAATAAAVPAVAHAVVPHRAAAHGAVAQFERVLASAGVDVGTLFAQFGVDRGTGGPYIPAPRGSQPTPLTADKLAALSRLVKSLPVSAPLASYEISSRFGVRGDPVNHRASLHTGTDLRAPYMSPVYATAAGVVTFSGYRDDYGKIVEIDHGNGIVTRYGHLHRTTVSVGQRVAAHSQVGFLGSTGRATGPHVHYEVLVNGEPQDPEKFIGLARVVPVVLARQ